MDDKIKIIAWLGAFIFLLSSVSFYPTDFKDLLGDKDFVVIQKNSKTFEMVAADPTGECNYLRWRIEPSHYKIYCGWSMLGDYYIRRSRYSNVTLSSYGENEDFAVVKRNSKNMVEYFVVGKAQSNEKVITGWEIIPQTTPTIFSARGGFDTPNFNREAYCITTYGEVSCYNYQTKFYNNELYIDYHALHGSVKEVESEKDKIKLEKKVSSLLGISPIDNVMVLQLTKTEWYKNGN